jgi:hypothetical protein
MKIIDRATGIGPADANLGLDGGEAGQWYVKSAFQSCTRGCEEIVYILFIG